MALIGIKIRLRNRESDSSTTFDKVVNVYDSYFNALSYGFTGLVDAYEYNRVTGVVGDLIVQTPKITGPRVDENGDVVFAVDDALSQYFINSTLANLNSPAVVTQEQNKIDATV